MMAGLASIQKERFQDVQITAWGSFALEVPSLNFRSFSLVSGEKVYSRDSEDYHIQPRGRNVAYLAHHIDRDEEQRSRIQISGHKRLYQH